MSKRKTGDCSGSTLVTTMVAFVILMLGLAMITTVIAAATSASAKVQEVKRNNRAIEKDYYTDAAEGSATEKNQLFVEFGSGARVYLGGKVMKGQTDTGVDYYYIDDSE